MKCKVCGSRNMEVAGYTVDGKIIVLRCTVCGACYLRRKNRR